MVVTEIRCLRQTLLRFLIAHHATMLYVIIIAVLVDTKSEVPAVLNLLFSVALPILIVTGIYLFKYNFKLGLRVSSLHGIILICASVPLINLFLFGYLWIKSEDTIRYYAITTESQKDHN
jgi:hypothetical protein